MCLQVLDRAGTMKFSIALLFVFVVRLSNSADCSREGLATSCRVTFPDNMVAIEDSIYVGLEDEFVQYSLDLEPMMRLNRRVDNEQVVTECSSRYRYPHCGNYILVMLATTLTENETRLRPEYASFANKTVLFICSTFSFAPRCQLCDSQNISHCVNTSTDPEVRADLYSPYDRRFHNAFALTREHYFYTGSAFGKFVRDKGVAKFTSPFTGSGTSLHTSLTLKWLNDPIFITLYEVDQFVYFFWRERVVEGTDTRVYSRVGRVCKNDGGLKPNQSNNVFSTFVKARLLCTAPGDDKNPFSFDYDELTTTYLSTTPGNPPELYAVFSTPTNGPPGSAVCTYSFDDSERSISTVFNGNYLVSEYNATQRREVLRVVSNDLPFDCPGEGPNQRSTEAGETQLLMEGHVRQSDSSPLHTEAGSYITSFTVDVIQVNNSKIELLYIGLSNGVVKVVTPSFTKQLHSTLSSSAVEKLVLHERNGIKYLYITSSNSISVLPLNNCNRRSICALCAEDVYCNWKDNSCAYGIPTDTTSCQVVDSSSPATPSSNGTTVDCSTVSPTAIKGSLDSNNRDDGQSSNVATVVGATLGGIAVGFIAAMLMLVTAYCIVKTKSLRKSKTTPASPEDATAEKDSYEDPFDTTDTTDSKDVVPTLEEAHPLANGRSTQGMGLPIGKNYHPTSHVGRSRTESTKRLMSVTSELYPDSPSPPSTMQQKQLPPTHHE